MTEFTARTDADLRLTVDELREDYKNLLPVLDLVRFLAQTWDQIDQFVYQHCDGEALMHYPVVQGTANQVKLRKIGQQKYDPMKLRQAGEYLLLFDTGEL